jgi:type IV secretory pathway VirB10-like protein
MTLDPATSPNFLDHGGRRGMGVRRLNRVPLMIAGMMLLLILGAVTYTYQMRLADMRRKAAEAEARPEPVNVPDLFSGAPLDGLIPAKPGDQAAPVPALVSPLTERPSKVSEQFRLRDEEWERYRQEQERRAAAREQRQRQAVGAPTRIQIQTGGRPAAPAQSRGSEEDEARRSQPSAGAQFAALYAAEARRQRRLGNGEEDESDLNRAAEKRAFLTDREPQGRAANYLSGGREAPVSPYEVKAGTVIPAIMISGISSDLPGQLIGQVTQNIYDSATGRYLLIPQGSKLVGTYDNAITTGQERVLVAWTRIIYPDSSSIDLGKMPGTDQGGLAGFHDEVNNHFWKMFSSALLMSVFSAGLQISQGGQTSDDGLNAQQSIAAGIGQQLGQLGQEIARRNTRIQPTLEIRPGYQFTVMVTKDMVIRPWRNTATASGRRKS